MRIDSGDVSAMVDASSKDLLDEIRRRHRRIQWHIWLAIAAALGLFMGIFQGSNWIIGGFLVALLVGTPLLWQLYT